MKLLLHIGTEKTGSTSFQAWGHANREVLEQRGVFYSRVLGNTNHVRAYLWALGQHGSDEGFGWIGVKNAEDFDAFHAALPGELACEVAEARAKGCKGFVISTELCHSRLRQEADVRRLRALLEPLFDEIVVVCYLRPQIDLMISHISTLGRVLTRVERRSLDAAHPGNPYFDYEGLIARWSAEFGADALKLVPYRSGPHMTALVRDLFALDSDGFNTPKQLNSAHDIRSLALTNALSGMKGEDKLAIRGFLRRILETLPSDDPPNPGLDAARAVQRRFDEANARLAEQRHDITAADLEPDWSRYDGPGNFDLLEQPCVFSEQLSALLLAVSARDSIMAVRVPLANAERAMARGFPDNAQKLLDNAGILARRMPGQNADADKLRKRIDRLGAEIAAVGDPAGA